MASGLSFKGSSKNTSQQSPVKLVETVHGEGVNPLAAYSKQLADKEMHIHRVSEDGVEWTEGTDGCQLFKQRRRDMHSNSTMGSADSQDEQRANQLELDLGREVGDGQRDLGKGEQEMTMNRRNKQDQALQQVLDVTNDHPLHHPLVHVDSRPSLSSSSNGTSSAPTFSTSTSALSYAQENGSETTTTPATVATEDTPRLSLSCLPGPLFSTSSGLFEDPKEGLLMSTFPGSSHDIPMHTVIPPTPPTASSYPPTPPRSPTPSTPRSSTNSNAFLSPDPASPPSIVPQSIRSSPPPAHKRSLSYQNSTASSSSLQKATNSNQLQGIPTRRSSLRPPSPASAYSSSLPASDSSYGLRKRGSLASSPLRNLSFRNTFSNNNLSAHPVSQNELFRDEALSQEQQAQQQQSVEELEDSIARQAEQIRKERLSKRIENERAQAKAIAALKIDQAGEQAVSTDKPIDKDKGGKGKERERFSDWERERDRERDLQSSPTSPTFAQSQLWTQTSPVGEKTGLRVDVGSMGVIVPVTSGPTASASAHGSVAVGSVGPMSAAAAKDLQSGPDGSAVLVGNLIGEDHVNYVMMYNMLTGIRIGVSRCEAKVRRPLTAEDYSAAHKFSFDMVGNELTPSARYDFKFKDYAPWVFRELREYFHLDPADYLLSLTAKYILSELGSPGKSGSFFYFSRDYRFIIKTISHTEHKFLRAILKEYYKHVVDNPHTLISRFYGLHRVKLPRGRKIHFVIMNNLFPPHRDIHETYDLKGSSIGREFPEDLAAKKPRATLKDLNWIHRGRQIEFGPHKRQVFEEQLRKDVLLLQRLQIMDYSLLIGIHDMYRGNSENLRDGLLTVFQPEMGKLRRRPTIRGDLERQQNDASALRKAVQRSDPKALNQDGHKLPDKDRSERKHFLFYQDEGGIRATNEMDMNDATIYYLGIIDILTPYNWYKKGEHFFRGFKYDTHRVSAVPPEEYGTRFLAFLLSCIRGADQSKRPKME